ncbi:MAG: resuscitation-promoting factor [Pseudonocardia sediminis]
MVEHVVRTGRTSRDAFGQHGGATPFPQGGAPAGLENTGRHRSLERPRTGRKTAVAAALFSLPTGGLAAAVLSPELPGAEQTASLKADLAASSTPLAAAAPQAAMSIVPVSSSATGTLQSAAASPMNGQQIVELQKMPAPEKVVEDDSLPEGTKTVVDPGAEGARSTIWRVNYANGKEVSRERIGAGATTPAKPKVVKVGTKKKDAPASEAGDDAGKKAAPAVSGGAVWDKLSKCEAGGDWSTNSGNGYYGGLQFDTQTWNAYGGDEFAPRPDQASREEQIAVANKVKDDRGGYSAWPACSSKLGLS